MPFANFHAAVAVDCCGVEDPTLIIGNIFPDVYQFSNLGERTTHRCGRKMKRFLKRHNPEYIQFAVGVKMHDRVDYLAEKKYAAVGKGYVFWGWEPLAKLLGESIHFLPEAGLDAFISLKHPELTKIVLASVEEVDVNELSGLLAKFFGKKMNMEEFFPYYLECIRLYEKGIDLGGRQIFGHIYKNFRPYNHERFYSYALKVVQKKYSGELHEVYKRGEGLKRTAEDTVRPHHCTA